MDKMNPAIMEKATAALSGKKPKGVKHGMRSTHIDHHTDGSHTVRHNRISSMEKVDSDPEISYAVKDTPELQAKIKEYLGEKEEVAEGDTKKDSPEEVSKKESLMAAFKNNTEQSL